MKNALLLATLLTAASQAQTPNFKEQLIDAEVGIGYGLAIGDVNGDQRADILLADSNVIVWYENPTWKKHIIAEKLTAIQNQCPEVEIGSYPFIKNQRLGTSLVSRSTSAEALDKAYAMIKSMLLGFTQEVLDEDLAA
jgi:hypothetical protein